jgi:hypothetical protein
MPMSEHYVAECWNIPLTERGSDALMEMAHLRPSCIHCVRTRGNIRTASKNHRL